MSKRIKFIPKKRQKIIDRVMQDLKVAESRIDPTLLKQVRREMREGVFAKDRLKIDREKNLDTIEKLLYLTANRKGFHSRLKETLTEI